MEFSSFGVQLLTSDQLPFSWDDPLDYQEDSNFPSNPPDHILADGGRLGSKSVNLPGALPFFLTPPGDDVSKLDRDKSAKFDADLFFTDAAAQAELDGLMDPLDLLSNLPHDVENCGVPGCAHCAKVESQALKPAGDSLCMDGLILSDPIQPSIMSSQESEATNSDVPTAPSAGPLCKCCGLVVSAPRDTKSHIKNKVCKPCVDLRRVRVIDGVEKMCCQKHWSWCDATDFEPIPGGSFKKTCRHHLYGHNVNRQQRRAGRQTGGARCSHSDASDRLSCKGCQKKRRTPG